MKKWLAIYVLLITLTVSAQNENLSFSKVDFGTIDNRAQWIDAETPNELAAKLTEPYTLEVEKVRSIFSWITTHISYNLRRKKPPVYPLFSKNEDADTGKLPPLNERVAINVLQRREAVCDGYARLFQNLCEHAGIQSKVIHGYAKANGRPAQFSSNHAWNAVSIDSNWYLMDVTWAAGFVSYNTNEYVRNRNERYFMADPADFISDHYPEDLKWTLLTSQPVLREFQKMPFKYGGYIRRQIVSHSPLAGTIEASVGDSIAFEILSKETEKNLYVTDDIFVDTAALATVPWQALTKQAAKKITTGNITSFTYAVQSSAAKWLNVIFNDEIVMRYYLKVTDSFEKNTVLK